MAGRDEINYAALEEYVRSLVAARLELARQMYVEEPLSYDDPSYPWREHDNQRSIRDPGSHTIEPTPTGMRIIVESAAAWFIERGNRPRSGSFIRPRTKPFLLLPRRGGGFDALLKVEPYEGTNRLFNSVARAFGLPVQ